MQFLTERIGRLLQEISERISGQIWPIEYWRLYQPDSALRSPVQLEPFESRNFSIDETWNSGSATFWFSTDVAIPAHLDGRCVIFELTTGRETGWDAVNPQFTLFVNGRICQGLDVNHRQVILSDSARAGEIFQLAVSADSGDADGPVRFLPVLRALDRKSEDFYYDASVPYQIATLLPSEHPARLQIIDALNQALNLIDLRRNSDQYEASLAAARQHLSETLYAKAAADDNPVVSCVGHTHIDVAWLWPLSVTRRKVVRSFATALSLMDRYPEFIFMSSQPQLYKFIEEEAPELFERIRQRVKEGRWEANGAMFVEADCNIASGEALVRQILVGTRYFEQAFGVTNDVLWLPDVFGYSAALPQIMQKSGLPYFMTTKISWNETNKMPYDTFQWEGIDGSRVLTHFIPTRDYNQPSETGSFKTDHFTTYNGELKPSQVMGGWQRYQQKDLNRDVLMAFGFGDGGGGPTRVMLENQRRLSRGLPGSPQTHMSTVHDFFAKLDAETSGKKELPDWVGELYLEYHRGTYTSMARNKNYNRRAEFAWLNTEWSQLTAWLFGLSQYPRAAIDEGWETVLRNQFHDILPGSSIRQVYEDSKQEYEQTLNSSRYLLNQSLDQLAGGILKSDPQAGLVVFNPNGLPISAPVYLNNDELPQGTTALDDGTRQVPLQRLNDGRSAAWLSGLPSRGWRAFRMLADSASGPDPSDDWIVQPGHLENEWIRIRLDAQGRFIDWFDKRCQRNILPAGQKANQLITYEDKPHNYDAWDINNYYTEKSWPVDDIQSITVIEDGPVCAALRMTWRYLSSTISQVIRIWRDSPQVDLGYEIDWQEEQILLKALFPVDVLSRQATYEIQYGNVQRPTHHNTSWDQARFEVCMHKWLDLSEEGYGVSILNDSKYGCGIDGQMISISLLKSALHPNPDADKEHHSFTLSLLPHQGDWRSAGIVAAAYALNNPPLPVLRQADADSTVPNLPKEFSLLNTDQDNVIIEAVKLAEEDDAMIIRLYECHGRRTECQLTFGRALRSVNECDLKENQLESLPFEVDQLTMTFRPYDIRTLKVRLAAELTAHA